MLQAKPKPACARCVPGAPTPTPLEPRLQVHPPRPPHPLYPCSRPSTDSRAPRDGAGRPSRRWRVGTAAGGRYARASTGAPPARDGARAGRAACVRGDSRSPISSSSSLVARVRGDSRSPVSSSSSLVAPFGWPRLRQAASPRHPNGSARTSSGAHRVGRASFAPRARAPRPHLAIAAARNARGRALSACRAAAAAGARPRTNYGTRGSSVAQGRQRGPQGRRACPSSPPRPPPALGRRGRMWRTRRTRRCRGSPEPRRRPRSGGVWCAASR